MFPHLLRNAPHIPIVRQTTRDKCEHVFTIVHPFAYAYLCFLLFVCPSSQYVNKASPHRVEQHGEQLVLLGVLLARVNVHIAFLPLGCSASVADRKSYGMDAAT